MWNQWYLIMLIPLSYLVGLSIVRTVDHRMSDISINMPKVVLPPQNITVRIEAGKEMETFKTQGNVYQTPRTHPLKKQENFVSSLDLERGLSRGLNEMNHTNVYAPSRSLAPGLGKGLKEMERKMDRMGKEGDKIGKEDRGSDRGSDNLE